MAVMEGPAGESLFITEWPLTRPPFEATAVWPAGGEFIGAYETEAEARSAAAQWVERRKALAA